MKKHVVVLASIILVLSISFIAHCIWTTSRFERQERRTQAFHSYAMTWFNTRDARIEQLKARGQGSSRAERPAPQH